MTPSDEEEEQRLSSCLVSPGAPPRCLVPGQVVTPGRRLAQQQSWAQWRRRSAPGRTRALQHKQQAHGRGSACSWSDGGNTHTAHTQSIHRVWRPPDWKESTQVTVLRRHFGQSYMRHVALDQSAMQNPQHRHTKVLCAPIYLACIVATTVGCGKHHVQPARQCCLLICLAHFR